MSKYRKTITALVTGLIGWAGVVITSAPTAITASEWLGLGVAAATALGVYAVPNEVAYVAGEAAALGEVGPRRWWPPLPNLPGETPQPARWPIGRYPFSSFGIDRRRGPEGLG